MKRKITYSPYELKGPRFNRQGALLKVEFDQGLVGYADCHPWPELGDLPLKGQIESLFNGKTTPLTFQSLYFAALDAQARNDGVHLLNNLKIPDSHALLPNHADLNSAAVAIEEGFSHFKIKAQHEDLSSIKPLFDLLLQHTCKLRIDFNNKLTFEQFQQWMPQLEKYASLIDFIEDPFPYDRVNWKSIKAQNIITLACDFNPYYKSSAHIYVLKPAVQSHHIKAERIVVTSYLDHPLGQSTAAFIAGQLQKTELCGLLSHRVYDPNPYSQQLSQKGPVFSPAPGTGFGFDDLLKAQKWKMFI